MGGTSSALLGLSETSGTEAGLSWSLPDAAFAMPAGAGRSGVPTLEQHGRT